MLRTLAVVAACVGVNARPLPARPVGTLSEPFWGGDAPKTTVKTTAHKKAAAHTPKKAAAHKSAPTAHEAAPKHSLDAGHGHAPPVKHTLDDGHSHSSPELVAAPPAADQAREAQLPARKLTTEEKAAQKASEAREAMAVAAEAERAKAEAKKLGDQEKRIADDEQRVADSEAERKHVEKMQRAAEQHGRGEDAASSTAKSTADAKQRKEVHKQTVLLSPQDWPYPDLPQDDPADNNAEAPAANDCVSVAAAATDFWCQSTCTGSYCPEDLCRCGDDQAAAQASEQAVAPANAERPATQAPQRNAHGDPITPGDFGNRLDDASEKECKSVDATTTDVWCSTTCVNANNCPANLCKCDTFTGERLKARRAERARVCDFDAKVCVGTGGGAVDCRPCDGHISTCMSTTHTDKDKQVKKTTLSDCLDEVSRLGEECSMCNTKESNKAYQMRLGTWQDEAEVDAGTGWPTEADAATPDPDEKDEGVRHWQTDSNWAGATEVECKSLDAQATDHWCQTTCSGTAANNCPKTLCECKTFSGSEMKQRAAEQKRTCDFDAQACIGADCRSCDAHISTCKGTTHLDKDNSVKAMDIEDCMDEVASPSPSPNPDPNPNPNPNPNTNPNPNQVAGSADGCSMCSTAESKKAYRVRLGLPEGAR